MLRFVFLVGVAVCLRIEYLVGFWLLSRFAPSDWSYNKKRIFAVRIVSFTHALVSSIACVTSLVKDHNYTKEPYDYYARDGQYVLLFSMGYFIYDLFDMFIHGELPNSKEYIIHHSLVITTFSIIMVTGRLMGLAMIGLLVEVQTVFLHLRTMIRLCTNIKKGNVYYDALINANMICLFLFRHLPAIFLLFYLLVLDHKVPLLLKAFLVAGLTFLEYHNTHLTISMAQSDGFFGHEPQPLDEDNVDPLGSVKKTSKENAESLRRAAELEGISKLMSKEA
ncbi:hypothetical protein WR25_14200 [Diploscapter pachys]|uniref:TLC domain-containing protein n=1 Tax=Diploscapter pachys TaxID=2018661 RepID=A0A2A2LZU5_9BILA|nr:hypothetical protein WR25_14200 [Diploscapter pachys]